MAKSKGMKAPPMKAAKMSAPKEKAAPIKVGSSAKKLSGFGVPPKGGKPY